MQLHVTFKANTNLCFIIYLLLGHTLLFSQMTLFHRICYIPSALLASNIRVHVQFTLFHNILSYGFFCVTHMFQRLTCITHAATCDECCGKIDLFRVQNMVVHILPWWECCQVYQKEGLFYEKMLEFLVSLIPNT